MSASKVFIQEVTYSKLMSEVNLIWQEKAFGVCWGILGEILFLYKNQSSISGGRPWDEAPVSSKT